MIEGLIFGAGFALLGCGPGTAVGGFGTGALDALVGMAGIALGAGIFARLYPRLDTLILNHGIFPSETIPELTGIRPGIVVIPDGILIIGLFCLLAVLGF